MSSVDVASPLAHGIRRSLNVGVHRACKSCGCPGIYQRRQLISGEYPSVTVSEDDARLEQPVGETCPHCGAARPAPEDLGEVWHQETSL